jgi:hypothetical protein
MKHLLAIFAVSFLSFNLLAEEPAVVEPEPLDPGYMGVHGMVVFTNGSTLYASHLPTYKKPHNAQIVYRIDSSGSHLIHLARDADLVTLRPKPFNLQELIRGNEITVKADVFMGHFERGGFNTYQDVDITFTKQVYVRMLEDFDLDVSSIRRRYDSADLNSGARLLIHQIQKAPSYDHIVLFYEKINCITQFNSSNEVPEQGELINRLSFCGSMKPLYYETQDFQKSY